MRPITFWGLVAAAIFIAMTVLFAFGEEQTGVVLWIAGTMYWLSGVTLVIIGLMTIARWRRGPERTRAARDGERG